MEQAIGHELDIRTLLSIVRMQRMTIDACVSVLSKFPWHSPLPEMPDDILRRLTKIEADYP